MDGRTKTHFRQAEARRSNAGVSERAGNLQQQVRLIDLDLVVVSCFFLSIWVFVSYFLLWHISSLTSSKACLYQFFK